MSSGNQNQPQTETGLSFEFKRGIVGGLSLCCLLLALAIYLPSRDLNDVVLASALRIGTVLFAIWLALPQLRGIMSKLPDYLPVAALVLVVLCAARPKIFSVVGSLVVVGTALIGISKWIRNMTDQA